MYLKLTSDHTATFYNNESLNAESKNLEFCFNPCHNPAGFTTFCFEADITANLRTFLKGLGVEMNADISKILFCLYPNGDIGPCS